MAVTVPAKPSYFTATGGSPPRHQLRRPSFKKTHVSSGPGVSAPRTHCPKDVDAFSYDPKHLQRWMMPQHLWDQLPQQLTSPLTSVHQAGAAVQTGLDRIEEIRTTLLDKLIDLDQNTQAPSIEQIAQVIDGADAEESKRARARHDSVASPLSTPPLSPDGPRRANEADTPLDSGINTPLTLPTKMQPIAIPYATKLPESTLPTMTASLRTMSLQDGCFVDDTPCSPLAGPQSVLPAVTTPSSPPLALHPSYPVAPPCHPHEKYYAAELLELRCVSLIRLRHSSRRVDVEWTECKHHGGTDADVVREFEAWWADRKRDIIALEDEVLLAEKAGPPVGAAAAGLV